MGAIFSRPKPPPPPDPSVSEALANQERRAAEDERRANRRLASRSRARRTGGMSQLMSPGVVGSGENRDVLNTSLGAGRNPRG